MGKPLRVTAGVIHRGREVFIAQRPKGANFSGYWEFPGGKIEAGETPEQCLMRELQEELGIETRIIEHLITTTHYNGDFCIELAGYRVEVVDGQIAVWEHTDGAWVLPEDLHKWKMTPADSAIVELLVAE